MAMTTPTSHPFPCRPDRFTAKASAMAPTPIVAPRRRPDGASLEEPQGVPQLGRTERLPQGSDDVEIKASPQPAAGVEQLGMCPAHDDDLCGASPFGEALEKADAIHIRKDQVEKDAVGWKRVVAGDEFVVGSRGRDLKPLGFGNPAHEIAYGWFIVDDENPPSIGGAHPLPLPVPE